MNFFASFLPLPRKKAPQLELATIDGLDEFIEHFESSQAGRQQRSTKLESLLLPGQQNFNVKGYCYVCRRSSAFLVDYQYCHEADGKLHPNWRERLVCRGCDLNARSRATIQVFEQQFCPHPDATLYVTEQTTPLFTWFRNRYKNVIGSEFLGDKFEPGEVDARGLRHEDLTHLSFETDSLDYILSFDVFEHIPNFISALQNCFDCLKPGGQLYFSVPFIKNSPKNVRRARIDDHGRVEHLLPPQFHGDPVNAGEGCLCFHEFGWELIDQLREIGFQQVLGLMYWSEQLAYLGDEQILFTARKPDLQV